MRNRSTLIWTLLVGVTAGACSSADSSDSAAAAGSAQALVAGEPTLEEVRAATLKYQDVTVALADGYIRDPMNLCDKAEMMGFPAAAGAMGVHYFRPDLLGITAQEPRINGTSTHIDFLQPSVLIYEPKADGSMELVAVENLSFVAAWEAGGNTAPPSFQSVPFDLMRDDPATPLDEGHMFEPHYDRHVWIYRENPAGVYAQFNPNVSCAAMPAA